MKDYSEAAFPAFGVTRMEQKGMTLRDYFAAQALPGLQARSTGVAPSDIFQKWASAAYAIADAMLAERAR